MNKMDKAIKAHTKAVKGGKMISESITELTELGYNTEELSIANIQLAKAFRKCIIQIGLASA